MKRFTKSWWFSISGFKLYTEKHLWHYNSDCLGIAFFGSVVSYLETKSNIRRQKEIPAYYLSKHFHAQALACVCVNCAWINRNSIHYVCYRPWCNMDYQWAWFNSNHVLWGFRPQAFCCLWIQFYMYIYRVFP